MSTPLGSFFFPGLLAALLIASSARAADAGTDASLDADASSVDAGAEANRPDCIPRTCQDLAVNCGIIGDGCGYALDCGVCTPPAVCGGGGFSRCGPRSDLDAAAADGPPVCVPLTCQAFGYTCGMANDGCGGLLSCGTCAAPDYCGSGGPNRCTPGAGGADAAVESGSADGAGGGFGSDSAYSGDASSTSPDSGDASNTSPGSNLDASSGQKPGSEPANSPAGGSSGCSCKVTSRAAKDDRGLAGLGGVFLVLSAVVRRRARRRARGRSLSGGRRIR